MTPNINHSLPGRLSHVWYLGTQVCVVVVVAWALRNWLMYFKSWLFTVCAVCAVCAVCSSFLVYYLLPHWSSAVTTVF